MQKLLIILLLITNTALANQPKLWLDLNIYSWHSKDYYIENDTKKEFSKSNPGVFLRYEVHKNLDIGAGLFYHSYEEWTPALGIEVHTSRSKWVSIGTIIGYAPGYKDTPQNTVMFVLPIVQIQTPTLPALGMRIGYSPFGEVDFGTVQLTLGF